MRSDWRRLLPPILAAIVLFAAAAAAGYLTKSTSSVQRVDNAASVPPAGARGALQSINGSTITVVTEVGPRQFTLADDVTVEVLRPTTASTINLGEWLNAGAMPHNQTVFTIVGLTLIPQGLVQDR